MKFFTFQIQYTANTLSTSSFFLPIDCLKGLNIFPYYDIYFCMMQCSHYINILITASFFPTYDICIDGSYIEKYADSK